MKSVSLDEVAALMWWTVVALRVAAIVVVIGAPAWWLHTSLF